MNIGNNYQIGMNTGYPMGVNSDYRLQEQTPAEKKRAIAMGLEECQTCKNRKYVDGSNESDVSFKTPGHVDPGASVGAVVSHERQHVANAVAEGNKANKELVSATVRIKMARCPECGRAYSSGGETSTVIKVSKPRYNNTPYDKARKLLDANRMAGANVDAKV